MTIRLPEGLNRVPTSDVPAYLTPAVASAPPTPAPLNCACGCTKGQHKTVFGKDGPVKGGCRDCDCDEYAAGATGYLPAPDPDLVDPRCDCGCRRSEHRQARGDSRRAAASQDWYVACSRCGCRQFRDQKIRRQPIMAPQTATVAPSPARQEAARSELVAAARGGLRRSHEGKRFNADDTTALLVAARAYCEGGLPVSEVAAASGFAESSIKAAAVVLSNASDLVGQVTSGEMSVWQAAQTARIRRHQQRTRSGATPTGAAR